ncbi:Exoglucanase 1 [Sphagnurus paluster]|uniref:Glucanase n=1 Tax=Sphagnurus paluster TaxID=117069 RepID=A0A9P7FNV2_9AGAR|nr:Exoglucanase 1 [Sphagnurus paluster]
MFPKLILTALSFLAVVSAQQVGTSTAEVHPKMSWKKCTKAGGCTVQSNASITLDANWRWVHGVGGYNNCYTGQTWDKTLCPDGKTCAANCALEGADYAGNYGITTSGDSLTLKFVQPNSNGKNVGSRVYLMNSDTQYEMFKLLNQEFTFDVDVSNLPCGLNGALYFSEMDADGGAAKYPTNKAGAKYGTGYCDSQCPRDIKYIAGEANSNGWTPSTGDPNSGKGTYGACCNEMDIWEANSVSTAYTPHPCSVTGLSRCTGASCGTSDRYATVCDPDGCDFNSYRLGDTGFYGKGLKVDTSKKFTVVTQFITNTNTATGTLTEIRRLYVQNGVVIQNSKVNIPGITAGDSITGAFCDAQKSVFGDKTQFQAKGGLAAMGKAGGNGMVLVMSIWDDYDANMLWLDSSYPTTANPSTPGVKRGTCATTSGKPSDVESASPNSSVTFSNIRFGEIGSTYGADTGSTSTPPSSTSTAGNPTATQVKYGQWYV